MTTIVTPTSDRSAAAPVPAERWAPRLERVVGELEEVLVELEPERCDGAGALRMLGLFARALRAAAAGEALAAGRVEACGAHRHSGHRSAAHLLAEISGTSVGRASEVVETGTRLRDCGATDAALRSGTVSVEQAHAVTAAAGADPSCEQSLLRTARTESVRSLRERARDVRLAADDDRLGRYRRQRAARSLRHGRDDDGMIWGRFLLPPDTGAALVTRLERQADREYRRAEDRCERHDRFLADALVALCTTNGDGSPGEQRAEVVVHVSAEALLRGSVEPGERCAIPGAGPVPVDVPRRLLADGAFLTGVVVDGTEVATVRRFGRRRPADLQTALETRAVLADGGLTCVVDGCGQRFGLEWDHDHPHAAGGSTSYDNLRPLCRHHHRNKTDRDRRSGPDPP